MVGLLGLAWLVTGGRGNPEATSGPFLLPPEKLDSDITTNNYSGVADSNYYNYNSNPDASSVSSANRSTYFGQFFINQGNAQYESQPNREYISITYQGEKPVDITGWYLTNGKGERTYDVNGSLTSLKPDVALLPRVTKLFQGGGNNLADSSLIVSRGSEVFITSGSLPSTGYFPPILNFQTNICSGYLEEMEYTNFSPSLWSSCPLPRDWPASAGVANECYQYLTGLGACRTPKFERKTDGLDYIDGYRDQLTSACRTFVQQNFNYNGCVATFSSRADFYKNEWRVYLNRPWEMWARDRETITLYDQENKIVAQTKYGFY